jgi:hypothetical protein
VDAEVRFFECDILTDTIPNDYDIVTNSLFLHHLGEDDAVGFLKASASAAKRLVLVNDLARCLSGYMVARVATRFLTTSEVVHVDGPRSVEAAYSVEEARELARRAGLERAEVARCWPWRFLLSWDHP